MHWPALDGVRAVAIALVVAYHLGYLGGGWVGVDIFFVLSGFLITTLLLAERRDSGRIRLRAFWARRARRLLPAVLLLLVVLAVYAWCGGAGLVPAQLRSPALATLFYGANWQQLVAGHDYFAAYMAPSPLQHTWSLAIEEQYYVVWPLLLGLVLLGRKRLHLRRAGALTAVLVVASATWMGVAASVWGANRAYLGTDTRAWELLLGGLAAMCWPPLSAAGRPARWAVASAVGVAGVAVGVTLAAGEPRGMWDGGLLGICVAACVVVVGTIRAPGGVVARVLSWAPLAWLGRISYSLYLWHWPTIVLLNGETSGLDGTELLLARLAAMTAAATASYYLVEQPLRRADWKAWWRRTAVPVAIASTGGVILAATVTPTLAASAPISLPPPPPPPPSDVAGTTTTTTPLAVGPGGTPSEPWRVWILGDSVMADGSPGVTAALESTGDATVVANSSFGGWGLTTDHSWPGDAEQIIAQYHPQVVIGTWSWDNSEAATDSAAYEARLQAALQVLLQPGDGVELVVLMQFPQPGPNGYITDPAQQEAAWIQLVHQQDDWNNEARLATEAFPQHALYLTTDSLFAPGGRYFAWLRDPAGAWVRARKADNAHMCPYGAAEWGALITADLTPILHLGPTSSGWELGPWTKDPRYNDPPGVCPADQPPSGYDGSPVPAG